MSIRLALAGLALALTPPAVAGDVRIEVTGSVTSVTGALFPPLQNAAVGDPFFAIFEIIDDPTVVTASFYEYPVDLLQGFVRIGTAQTEFETIGTGQLNLQDGVIDGITMGGPVNAGLITGISLGYIDITGAVLSGPDLNALVGTTVNITANSYGTLLSMPGGGQVDLVLTQMRFLQGTCPRIGTNYCDAEDNSIGREGEMAACGSLVAGANNVMLTGFNLPDNSFGFFLASRQTGLSNNPGGSQGNLCLGGSIGRFVGPGQIQNSGTNKRIELQLDLTQFPTPTGPVTVVPGDVFHFTAWYRDTTGGTATSNFTDGLTLVFL